MREIWEGILYNRATLESLYWREISEDEDNYYLHNYIIVKYGERSDIRTLPKFIWDLKQKIGDNNEPAKPAKKESKKKRKSIAPPVN